MIECNISPPVQECGAWSLERFVGRQILVEIRSDYLESKYNVQMNRSKVAVTGVNAGM